MGKRGKNVLRNEKSTNSELVNPVGRKPLPSRLTLLEAPAPSLLDCLGSTNAPAVFVDWKFTRSLRKLTPSRLYDGSWPRSFPEVL